MSFPSYLGKCGKIGTAAKLTGYEKNLMVAGRRAAPLAGPALAGRVGAPSAKAIHVTTSLGNACDSVCALPPVTRPGWGKLASALAVRVRCVCV